MLNSSRLLTWTGILLTVCGLLRADAKKSVEDQRVELLRGLSSEYAKVKTYLPRSRKALEFESDGTWDKQKWELSGRELGPAARVGDLVQVTTPYGIRTYAVDSTEVVKPTETSVTVSTATPTLTLITCYPFYYVGHAPKRFIVRASPVSG